MVTAVQGEKQVAIVRTATSVSGENLRRQEGRLAVGGLVPFERAWAMQRELVKNRIAGRSPDTLVLLEHEPVFTIGRTGRQEHWGGDEVLSRRTGVPLYHIERGGSITYHGPGQRVLQTGKRHVNIAEIKPVGNYAVLLMFDDGHQTGIYSWDTLYELGRDQEARWQAYLDELAAAGAAR